MIVFPSFIHTPEKAFFEQYFLVAFLFLKFLSKKKCEERAFSKEFFSERKVIVPRALVTSLAHSKIRN